MTFKNIFTVILTAFFVLSFSDFKKAEKLNLEPFYSQFQEALEQARLNHTWCVAHAFPSIKEIDPRAFEKTNPDVAEPTLLEQYATCYHEYAKDSLTLICEKEKELSKRIQSLEEEPGEEDFELKKQLDFITLARKALEEKGSGITAEAYKNNSTAQGLSGTDKAHIAKQNKLLNSSLGVDSCHTIQAFNKAGELEIEPFYSQFQYALKQAKSNHSSCAYWASLSVAEIDPRYAQKEKQRNPNVDLGPSLMEKYLNCYHRYAKDSLSLICEKERQLKKDIRTLAEEGGLKNLLDLELKIKQLDFITSQRQAEKEQGTLILVNTYKNNRTAQMVHGSDMARENLKTLSNLGLGVDSCDEIKEE